MSAKQVEGRRLNLPGVTPINMLDATGRNKRSVVRESNAYKNANAVLDYFKEKGGPDPYEGYTVLNLEEAKKTDKELASMKTAFFSFVVALKELVKKKGLEKEVKVVARGDQFVHVGNAKD